MPGASPAPAASPGLAPAPAATPPPWVVVPGIGAAGNGDPGTGAPGDSPDGPGTAVDSPAPSDPPAGIVTPGAGTGGAGSGDGGSGGGGSGPRVDSPAGPEQASARDSNAAGPFGNDPLGQLVLLTAAVSTGTTLALAFLAFGRRRRNDEYDDEALAAAAATPYGMPVAVAVPMPRFDPGTGGTDVDLPRWRRPSLMAARKSDPVRGFDAPARLTFEPSAAGVDGERRRVRYRLVRLLDSPDELTGLTVDTVDAGDEVAVVESSGLYRRVVTPDGRTGWLHKMTLGEVIEAAPPDGDEGLDPDVLMAYLAARGRG